MEGPDSSHFPTFRAMNLLRATGGLGSCGQTCFYQQTLEFANPLGISVSLATREAGGGKIGLAPKPLSPCDELHWLD